MIYLCESPAIRRDLSIILHLYILPYLSDSLVEGSSSLPAQVTAHLPVFNSATSKGSWAGSPDTTKKAPPVDL